MKALIIDRPGLQTARQRLFFGSMTVVFWALWIYLWLPILAVIGWALGFKIAYYEMVVKNGYVGLLHLLGFYATVILCLGASLLLWAYYNLARFRGVMRRKSIPSSSSPSIAERYRVEPEVLAAWMRARRLVLHHDADGQLMPVNARP
ncbi:MAG TPA: poly-beta-1,6-N-acetyl-D-glucosamine biosynthesis protein PgaD [Steroidobacteraceae bacterium]|nr:poly-beta-1,6-N-acetyl-D-glucosamine biosynthesis protein PgaD [Steroidobacteraceae bacterium]